ncbi:MAG TPA: hypothetical protein VK766_08745 [Cytophagaceae bacterium]|jgi:hypothetical protein|nr:hypothetical protein [Cytophagaceae bacterium]
MTRTEYLETIEGQSQERIKRWIKTNYLVIQQEPKSKTSISQAEKIFFRQEVKRQLKERNRKVHTGDIILEIDFYTTKNNPPALHTLSKNYLDLLHKDIDEDKLGGLLFKDDGQIKILIANYHLNIFGKQEPEIRITSYSLSSFIKDIELTDRIYTNKFDDADSFMHRRFIQETQREESMFDTSDYWEDLRSLEKNKEKHLKQFGEQFYDLQKHFLVRQIQEKYLKQNEIGIRDLTSIFQRRFSYNKRYSADKHFQNIWNITSGYIFLSSDFVGLGNAPTQEGETRIFKDKLQEQLKAFKEKHKVLFPLLQPINVTITFVPPKHNVIDLDNLARYIVPFVNEIFRPPATHRLAYDNKFLNQLLKTEMQITQRFPPHSITGYQLIHIPRKEEDPEAGRIDFIITDGFGLKSNVWHLVDDVIDKWEKRF